MYCTHCGKKINENKIEEKKSSYNIANESLTNKTEIQYECPRCGEIIHNHISKEEEKSLERAAHAEIQRGHNSFSRGMGNFCIGVIVLIISLIFWRLSYKANNNFQLSTKCVEFYVFIVLLVIAVVLIILGTTLALMGIFKQKTYKQILKDIQNETFIQ